MGRGQAERLMPMLEELLSAHNATWADLSAIGVGVGPGNFTGIRISVAAARGLSLALGIPAYGVDSFAAIALGQPGPCLSTLPAPRGQLYLRAPDSAPQIVPAETAADYDLPVVSLPSPTRLAENIARIAASGQGTSPPAPLYVRAADAAPSKTPPPAILANDA